MAGPYLTNGPIHSTEKPMFYLDRWDHWVYNPHGDREEIIRAKEAALDETVAGDEPISPSAIIESHFPTHAQVPASELRGDFDENCSDCEESAPNEQPDDDFALPHVDYEDDEEDMEPCDCVSCILFEHGTHELHHRIFVNPAWFPGNPPEIFMNLWNTMEAYS